MKKAATYPGDEALEWIKPAFRVKDCQIYRTFHEKKL